MDPAGSFAAPNRHLARRNPLGRYNKDVREDRGGGGEGEGAGEAGRTEWPPDADCRSWELIDRRGGRGAGTLSLSFRFAASAH